MARIRSIHPGLWTDEAFMSLSAHSRLLLMGIWTEAFDDGVFEWKPLTLKARIFPVDDVDVAGLLDQLMECGVIGRDDAHPKKPGLIRNFQRFQRPKKPNSSGMLSDEWRTFVGWKPESSEPVPNQSPTDTEKPPQMEDGGGKGKEKERSEAKASSRNARADEFEDWYQHYPHKVQRGAAEKAFLKARSLATLEELIAGTQRYVASKPADYAWRNPATWLNGKGWLDAPAVVATSRPFSTASPQTGGSPKTFDEGGVGPRGQTKFLKQFEEMKKTQAMPQ